MIGPVIYSLLSNDATLTGLVGNYQGTAKIYPFPAPQGVSLPYVVYRVVQTDPVPRKDGASPQDQIAVQVESYTANYSAGDAIMEAVRNALDNYSGTVESQTVYIEFTNQSDEDFLHELDVVAKAQEYKVWHDR